MRFLLLFSLVVFALPTFAQNTEQPDPLRPSLRDSTQLAADSTRKVADSLQGKPKSRLAFTPVYRFRLTTDGTFTSGNVNRSLLQIVSAFDVEVSKVAKLSTTPSFVFGRQSGLLAEREYFGDARLTMFYENNLYYLAFGSYERSNLRQIQNRYTAAAGIGYKLLTRKHAYLSITDVLIREYTDYMELSDVNIWRNSARLFGEYTFDKDRWSVSHTVFYQPALSRQEGQPLNVRWNGSVSVQYKFSTYLSFRTTLANSYESVVVPGRVNNDLRLTVGMTYERK
ncbi:DUF481 domain-containing protein [uncultured Fibrella sp.]|uniref:DUF481 domain-containing protein n=1 Tax=uncultured Fibrella sp. TaxID=1284596 RepID=UPI0035CBC1C4